MTKPRPLRITRFTVMATLQAARVKRLGFSDRSAFSWGLNRAIFYAAAKRGFGGTKGEVIGGEAAVAPPESNLYSIGDDAAYRDPHSDELLFTIGGETQTEDAFRRQVAARFDGEGNFHRAWKEAGAIVDGFDEPVLRSGRLFYARVYRPRRDALVAKWSDEFLGMASAPAPVAGRSRARKGRGP